MALHHKDGTVTTNPEPDVVLAAGDTVIVLGREHDLPELRARDDLLRQVGYRGARASV